MFDMVVELTSGGPGSVTELASIQLKREAFEKCKTGYSSAYAVILFVTIWITIDVNTDDDITALDNFMNNNGIQLVCRAHQVVNGGYKFFHDNKLVTIFSAPNYCGEVGNNGAVMYIDENLGCSFTILKPVRQPLKRYDSYSTLPQE